MYFNALAIMKRRSFITTSLLASIPVLVNGEVTYVREGNAEYHSLRQLFNSDLSFKPAAIAPCKTEQDVVQAILFARKEHLTIAIKSGGHSFTGSSMNNGGLVIDLAKMRGLTYEPVKKHMIAGSGAKLGEVNNFLLPKQRILPAGSCSGVGISGLTLGGGYGLFARQWGLTSDHLQRIRMIDANGNLVDSEDDKELLWACRGGGNGNFGVITSMEFLTRPAPNIFGAQRFISRNLNSALTAQHIRSWFEITADLAEPLFSAFVMNDEQIAVLLTSSYATKGASFQKAANALQKAGFETKRATNSSPSKALKRYHGRKGPLPFFNVSGGYYESHDDIAQSVDMIIENVRKKTGLIFQINTLGGAIARGPDSAYAHRKYPYLGEIQAYWQQANQREDLISTARTIRAHIKAKAHYCNYPELQLEDWQNAYYGNSYARLQTVKKRLDPDNLFTHEQSVRLP